MTEIPRDDRLLTWSELKPRIPFSRQHVSRMEREKRFPQRRQVGPGRVAWLESEIDAWIESLPRRGDTQAVK